MFCNFGSKDIVIRNYQILRTLGEGTYGKVKLARHSLTGTEVALKVIRKSWWVSKESLTREVCNMKALSHPHIVQLFQVLDTKGQLILVMEYMEGGDLHDYLQHHGRLAESEARGMFEQLLSALSYCHRKGVVHRDLKAENILMDRQENVKLGDFGLSVQCKGQELSTCCGSPEYAAPEIYRLHRHYGPAADIWSLGVVLYFMVTGALPFVGDNFWKLRQRVTSGCFHVPAYLSGQCEDLLRKMLVLDPQARSSIEDLVTHPWVKMRRELLAFRELSYHHHDPAMTEAMVTMGFEKDEIHSSVAERKFDYIMATYLILHWKQQEGQGNAVLEKPSPVAVLDKDSLSQDCHLQPNVSRKKTLEIKGPIVSGLLQPQESGQKEGNQILALASLIANQEQRNTTSSPAPQSPSTTRRPPPGRGWHLRFHSNAIAPQENSFHAPEPDKTPASPCGHGQGRRATARQILNFVLRICCFCAPLCKQHGSNQSLN
ncbi:serine/threonine-protein kinase MARK2-like [Talpa occidentalis]|uniref:serine/threonine-protein kinase MARK2-like n=1 Tax=Talpa occidentalis TaxID=50954 RepID=UPI00188E684E|nr:serine/threonine-protein kinase MARK2-like [Talpa occidentalis]XP_037376986.1 serine/threonine-protein kinase MARK2-like [Talpa occidentalis]XP_037376987.1 serine/threonine-protein kinase MARK2-like [Talpa occidentalis]XP_037376988.1 serine/threonine-protein kinase MARK2-like [Talpa occidentalis]XP_037376990.1 serine/threonine-protein kinase MARK2-like [Talpa occidentalis]